MSPDAGTSGTAVQFVQYVRPNGARRPVIIDRDPDTARKAAVLLDHGCRFDIEELMNGMVSMTVERDVDGEDDVVSIRLCHNGPAVPENVDALVEEAYERVIGGEA